LAAVARPDLLLRTESFAAKRGALAIFIGRFLGPLRAVVSLSGRYLGNVILALPKRQFHFRLRLAAMLLKLGDGVAKVLKLIWP